MEITHQYAQSIVDRTMKVLGYNINIMNSIGIIVGSGDKKRIDTFHQGAAEVIKTGKPVEITLEQAKKLEGAKPGVNLPIYFNGKIAGVVGITGEPDEVRPFGELLRISVETMLQQAFLSERLRMEQSAKELYIDDIISGNFAGDEDVLLAKGEVLGFDMKLPRVAIVIKIYGLNEKAYNDQNQNDRFVSHNVEINLQKRREKILNQIRTIFNNPQNMISYSGSNNFIIFNVVYKMDIEEFRKDISNCTNTLHERFTKYGTEFVAGVGSLYDGIAGLKRSYDEAVKAINIWERIKGLRIGYDRIIFASDLSLEMLLSDIPAEVLSAFKEQMLMQNAKGNILRKTKLIDTLKAFFENDLNLTATAEKLDITRNTLANRLSKIKELSGYDPRKFNDAVKLKILTLINELDRENVQIYSSSV